jgi:hypothetical protein
VKSSLATTVQIRPLRVDDFPYTPSRAIAAIESPYLRTKTSSNSHFARRSKNRRPIIGDHLQTLTLQGFTRDSIAARRKYSPSADFFSGPGYSFA